MYILHILLVLHHSSCSDTHTQYNTSHTHTTHTHTHTYIFNFSISILSFHPWIWLMPWVNLTSHKHTHPTHTHNTTHTPPTHNTTQTLSSHQCCTKIPTPLPRRPLDTQLWRLWSPSPHKHHSSPIADSSQDLIQLIQRVNNELDQKNGQIPFPTLDFSTLYTKLRLKDLIINLDGLFTELFDHIASSKKVPTEQLRRHINANNSSFEWHDANNA